MRRPTLSRGMRSASSISIYRQLSSGCSPLVSWPWAASSIWGRTTWGTWWTWDARLTTTLILWFIYIGYLMLRSYMGRTPASARAGAVLAIIGIIDVPIIYESVNWWRTLHPPAQVGVQD